MKIIILLTLLSTTSFAQKLSDTEQKTLKSLAWLEGTWIRTNVKTGRTAHERWERNEQSLQGWGVSMNGPDTSFVERIRIIIKENNFYYVADVPQNKESTYFKFTELTTTGFICENPEHDFPKKISYQLQGTSLKATISGNGKSIDYLFERKD